MVSKSMDIILDRIPADHGTAARDWAGMQVTRLWAQPISERLVSGEFRDILATNIERKAAQTWILSIGKVCGTSSRVILQEWRRTASIRGGKSFNFISKASVESASDLLIETRWPIDNLREYLDAFDLWIGLSAADRATIQIDGEFSAKAEIDSAQYTEARILVDEDAASGDTLNFMCGLPGPFLRNELGTETDLTFVLFESKGRDTYSYPLNPGITSAVELFSQKQKEVNPLRYQLPGRLNLANHNPGDLITIGYTDFFPNHAVAECVAESIRIAFPDSTVRTSLQNYSENPEQFRTIASDVDYMLLIALPMNSSQLGIYHNCIALSGLFRNENMIHWAKCAAEKVESHAIGNRTESLEYISQCLGLSFIGHYIGRTTRREARGREIISPDTSSRGFSSLLHSVHL